MYIYHLHCFFCVVSAHLIEVQISSRPITRSLWALETHTNPCFDSAWNKLTERQQHCNVHAFLLDVNLIFHIVIASGPHHVHFPDKVAPSFQKSILLTLHSFGIEKRLVLAAAD